LTKYGRIIRLSCPMIHGTFRAMLKNLCDKGGKADQETWQNTLGKSPHGGMLLCTICHDALQGFNDGTAKTVHLRPMGFKADRDEQP
jgi:hypothetical protein